MTNTPTHACFSGFYVRQPYFCARSGVLEFYDGRLNNECAATNLRPFLFTRPFVSVASQGADRESIPHGQWFTGKARGTGLLN